MSPIDFLPNTPYLIGCLDFETWLSEKKAQKDKAFYVIDLLKVQGQYELWRKELPDFDIYYAVKCNPDPLLIQKIHGLGGKFDCASVGEIQLVMGLGVTAAEILFANPCKHPKEIAFAAASGVHRYTFDCVEELEKIAAIDPKAQLILRLKTDDSNSICQFSSKFGAEMEEVSSILDKAKNLGVQLIGTSFHVGSGCKDTISYRRALEDCKKVFEQAKTLGFELNVVDIGGGFPGFSGGVVEFTEIAKEVRECVKTLFAGQKLYFLGEPGRFLAANSHTLYVNVTSKKQKINTQTGQKYFIYYINEAVYGSFNCIYFDYYVPELIPLNNEGDLFPTTIFGQTCDSLDKIQEEVHLPELQIGDWLRIDHFGAYSSSPASNFNGFPFPERYYFELNNK